MTDVPSYRNQSIGLLCKSMDWFLYDRDFRHERVKRRLGRLSSAHFQALMIKKNYRASIKISKSQLVTMRKINLMTKKKAN